ncbi:MAG: 4Fe-4S binding protein [Euryarchaeota archaeon]|nr:4Fe-4S binding protein [Euryarchaeota archaeon]
MPFLVRINHETCNGNGECFNSCPAGVFEASHDGKCWVGGEKSMEGNLQKGSNEDLCVGCLVCVEVCPTKSITVTEK